MKSYPIKIDAERGEVTCRPSEATSWSIYTDGGRWVADCETRREAAGIIREYRQKMNGTHQMTATLI
jgi:hypothetical protein